jgi:hypothetical protein
MRIEIGRNLVRFCVTVGMILGPVGVASADLTAFESFEFTSERLDGVGSGIGWNGDWDGLTNGGLEIAEDGESLVFPDGVALAPAGGRVDSFRPRDDEGALFGAASQRLLASEFSLSAGNSPYYLSFLARRDGDGFFRVQARRSDGISRWGVRVGEDGTVSVGMDIWSDSGPGVIESDSTYLLVSKFIPGNPAVVHVKAFQAGVDTVPTSDAGIEWDATISRNTGVSQDRFFIAVSAGRVELDELRFGTSWEDVVLGAEKPTFEGWRTTHFTPQELEDPAISGPEADPAGDGVPNLLKYAFFDTDPKVPLDRGLLPQGEIVDEELLVTYPVRPNVTDIVYRAEVSDDLVTWRTDSHSVAEVGRLFEGGFAEQVTVAAVRNGPLAAEPFDISGERLNETGSGYGWSGKWSATTGAGVALAQDGESLSYPASSSLTASGSRVKSDGIDAASTRVLRIPINLDNGNPSTYISFLARRSGGGSFRLETERSDGVSRWGVDVLQNGIVGAKVANWEDSAPGVFQEDVTYLVVSKFRPGPGTNGASVRVKLFAPDDPIPADDSGIQWDVIAFGTTGIFQHRLKLSTFGGVVEFDELLISTSWADAVLQRAEESKRKFIRVGVSQLTE